MAYFGAYVLQILGVGVVRINCFHPLVRYLGAPPWYILKFPNAVALNAVGRRTRKCAHKRLSERKCKSAKGRKRAQKNTSA